MADTGEVLMFVFVAAIAVLALGSALLACSTGQRRAVLFRDGEDAGAFR